MKKRLYSVFLVLLVVALFAAMPAGTAFSAELPAVSVPVEIKLSGTLPEPAEDFIVKLAAADPSCPMPDGAAEGVYSMTVTGAASVTFPAITYDRVGIYNYTVYQEPGANAKCAYDATVYDLKVFITNAEDGGGLEFTAVLYPGDESDKQAVAAFSNIYETVPPPTPDPGDKPKTGDESSAALWAVLMALSVMAMAPAVFLMMKKNRAGR